MLLALKADFKSKVGKDWKPGMTLPSEASSAPAGDGNKVSELNDSITSQGNKVRELKSAKADKVN